VPPGDLLPVPLRQPDRRSCGAAVAVVARILRDPAYAASAARPAAFAAEVLARHRRLTGWRDADGRPQLAWPRALGTPPWALARELGRLARTPYAVRGVRARRDAAWDRLRAATPTRPVAVYVGSRRLPRHVVLVTGPVDAAGGAVRCYEPAAGREVRLERAAFAAGRCGLAGWDRAWFTVAPALTRRRARRTRA
jgi:hypothetical protein